MFEEKPEAVEAPAVLQDLRPPAAPQIDVNAFAGLSPAERMVELRRVIEGPVVFTHGFGIEGQLLFHWICERDIDVDVVTLDTGRLFPQTYELWSATEARYGR